LISGGFLLRVIPVSELINEEILSEIKAHLSNDGLLIYPTDTLYGMGCNFYSLAAQHKIDRIKERKDSPYSIAISNRKNLPDLISGSSDLFNHFSDRETCAKLTFLFKVNKNIDKKLVKGSDFIGVRIPDHKLIKILLDYLTFPLVSTSVNLTGMSPLDSPDDIEKMIRNSGLSDETIFINEGKLPSSSGSTIIDITGENIKIIRKGDNISKVEEYLITNPDKKAIG